MANVGDRVEVEVAEELKCGEIINIVRGDAYVKITHNVLPNGECEEAPNEIFDFPLPLPPCRCP